MLSTGPLTVKVVEEDGFEQVFQAVYVDYDRDPTVCSSGSPTGEWCLTAYGVTHAADGQRSFHHGIAYVMNEAGATVAKYHLSNSLSARVQKPNRSAMLEAA